jgi:DNA sulfur modification protein DndB
MRTAGVSNNLTGSAQYYELDLQGGPQLSAEELPRYMAGALGILELSGGEKLFALDGQHRLMGIKEALSTKEGGELGDEEISAIFVAHHSTPEGQERTRRLFSALNRYARPVSKKEIIALDEDDAIAIITRRLVDTYPLFTGQKTSTTRTASLPNSDRFSFTTIITLYDALDVYLQEGGGQQWAEFKRFRPQDEVIETLFDRAVSLFDALRSEFQELAELAAAPDEAALPERYRNPGPGHFLFRPVGFGLMIRAIRALQNQNFSLNVSTKRLSAAPMQLSDPIWANLLWDPVNRRMLTKSVEQQAALRVLVHGAGGELRALKTSEIQTRMEIAGLKNIPIEDVILPRFNDG